jgi:hypothetical protein
VTRGHASTLDYDRGRVLRCLVCISFVTVVKDRRMEGKEVGEMDKARAEESFVLVLLSMTAYHFYCVS